MNPAPSSLGEGRGEEEGELRIAQIGHEDFVPPERAALSTAAMIASGAE
jgi:hypothetical protein